MWSAAVGSGCGRAFFVWVGVCGWVGVVCVCVDDAGEVGGGGGRRGAACWQAAVELASGQRRF